MKVGRVENDIEAAAKIESSIHDAVESTTTPVGGRRGVIRSKVGSPTLHMERTGGTANLAVMADTTEARRHLERDASKLTGLIQDKQEVLVHDLGKAATGTTELFETKVTHLRTSAHDQPETGQQYRRQSANGDRDQAQTEPGSRGPDPWD